MKCLLMYKVFECPKQLKMSNYNQSSSYINKDILYLKLLKKKKGNYK